MHLRRCGRATSTDCSGMAWVYVVQRSARLQALMEHKLSVGPANLFVQRRSPISMGTKSVILIVLVNAYDERSLYNQQDAQRKDQKKQFVVYAIENRCIKEFKYTFQ